MFCLVDHCPTLPQQRHVYTELHIQQGAVLCPHHPHSEGTNDRRAIIRYVSSVDDICPQ